MKLSLPGLGKSKKQGDPALEDLVIDTQKTGVETKTPKAKTPKTPNGGKDEGSGKQGFMASLKSKTSLKSKKAKGGVVENGTSAAPAAPAVAPPRALKISRTEKELKDAFRVYDADNDGRISHAELSKVLTSLGGKISEQEVEALMKQIDKDKDGFISVEEFVEFHMTSAAPVVSVGGEVSPVHDPMRDAFQMFDKDGDSRISASELQSVLVSLGDIGHSIDECKQMINSVDKDGDGYVDFVEFQELMAGGQE